VRFVQHLGAEMGNLLLAAGAARRAAADPALPTKPALSARRGQPAKRSRPSPRAQTTWMAAEDSVAPPLGRAN